jgi:hypothetical protein
MKVKELKELPGMLTCVLEHEVTKTQANLQWTGPKISPEVWNRILSFFRWTYDTTHSESQVRLYVNPDGWSAWAFPQEARTGMMAKELDTEDARRQRELFAGHQYFGTVHSHCAMGASQSPGDEANETGRDQNAEHGDCGLHMTVGKLDQAVYDLHARLYISGHRFDPDMSWFWDVGHVLDGVPAQFLKDNAKDQIARMQMCVPPPADYPFPEQWKSNLIEVKREPVQTVYRGGFSMGWEERQSDAYPSTYYSKKEPYDHRKDVVQAHKELVEEWTTPTHVDDDPLIYLEWMEEQWELTSVIDNLYRNDVSLKALIEYFGELRDKENAAIELAEQSRDDGQLPQ